MMGRVASAGVATIAAIAALGFAVTAATLALANVFGMLVASAIMTALLAAIAATGVYLAWREPRSNGEEGSTEPIAMRLAREVIRKQPLSAIALFSAIGFAAARRPSAAADIGRGVARLMLL
jgi:hypothetical protein